MRSPWVKIQGTGHQVVGQGPHQTTWVRKEGGNGLQLLGVERDHTLWHLLGQGPQLMEHRPSIWGQQGNSIELTGDRAERG